jgi:ABC-type multidrug transport system ATPase subunit
MGSSGAGKTSLLNMLSDRVSLKNGATLSGKILINDSTELN